MRQGITNKPHSWCGVPGCPCGGKPSKPHDASYATAPEAQHTPGPWHFDGHGINSALGERIATLPDCNKFTTIGEADGTLLAAAPELLAENEGLKADLEYERSCRYAEADALKRADAECERLHSERAALRLLAEGSSWRRDDGEPLTEWAARELEKLRATNAELLGALRSVLEFLDSGAPVHPYAELHDELRAAIANATGGK